MLLCAALGAGAIAVGEAAGPVWCCRQHGTKSTALSRWARVQLPLCEIESFLKATISSRRSLGSSASLLYGAVTAGLAKARQAALRVRAGTRAVVLT